MAARSALILAWLLAMATGGCVVDTDIPSNAQLTCTGPNQCPEGWSCDEKQGMCVAPGAGQGADTAGPEDVPTPDVPTVDSGPDAAVDTFIHRREDKELICAALYDQSIQCETDVRAILGDEVWALFEADKETFVQQSCVPELIASLTDAELDEYLGMLDLIALAPCDYFATEMCPMAAELFDDLPGC